MNLPSNRCFDSILDAAVHHSGGLHNLSGISNIPLEKFIRDYEDVSSPGYLSMESAINAYYASMSGNVGTLFERYFTAGLSLYIRDVDQRSRWESIFRFLCVYGLRQRSHFNYGLLAMLVLDAIVSIGIELPEPLTASEVSDLIEREGRDPFTPYREFYLLLKQLVVFALEVDYLAAIDRNSDFDVKYRSAIKHRDMVHKMCVSSLFSLVERDCLLALGADANRLDDFLSIARQYLSSYLNQLGTSSGPSQAFVSRAVGAYFNEMSVYAR